MVSKVKIKIKDLYKIFGPKGESHVERVKSGVGKTELLEKHSHVLGLQDINLDIIEGKIQVIMGLSGSGKSTLIRHINRLIEPTAGQIYMMMMSDRRQITAREIDERHEEKLLMLGPVLERLHTELLNPLIDRTFNIMARNDLLPPAPEELAGVTLKVEYISVMAQAQKAIGTGAIERLAGFVGNIAAAKPEVLDKFDADQSIDEYAEMLGVPPKIVKPDDIVQRIREERQAQMEQQMAMEQAQMGAQAAKVMSDADTEGNNVLTDLIGGIQ